MANSRDWFSDVGIQANSEERRCTFVIAHHSRRRQPIRTMSTLPASTKRHKTDEGGCRVMACHRLVPHFKNNMRILLTNDDGIYAPGLEALHDELLRLGAVDVVAPSVEQSGVGHSITYLEPLLAHDVFRHGRLFGKAVRGSPADCVKIAMLQFCNTAPDLVVSGINAGSNTGINVLYSGTVAGAIEGAFFGIRSIAVSLTDRKSTRLNSS